MTKDRIRTASRLLIPLWGKSCEVCGSTGQLHRHHLGYLKPEDAITVKILCQPCHTAEHRRLRPRKVPLTVLTPCWLKKYRRRIGVMATKEQIAARFRAWQVAKAEIGTVEALSSKHGITKARLYQIVDEVDQVVVADEEAGEL